MPTIGVGKTVFHVDGITTQEVNAECTQKLNRRGDSLELRGKSGRIWGLAVRSTDESKKPLIVSVGTRVSLKTAYEATMACVCKYRIPEPIR